MDLNMHLVRYLAAVVDAGHFGRAAGALFVSPPALSKQIRALERTLGTELLDRSAHPVRPTEAGARFLAEAREALAAADRAVAAVEAHRRELAGSLRLGFMTASTGPHTKRVLDEFRRDTRTDAVRLVQLPWGEQHSAVRSGAVDAALVRPPIPDLTGLRLDLIREEPRVAALAASHRLAGRASISVAELDGEHHVTDDEVDQAWVKWWACDPRPSGVPVRYGPTVHTMDELLEVVAAGEAIAITGALVADSYRHSDVVFVPVLDIDPCPISLCSRADDHTALVTALRRAVRRVRSAAPTS